MTHQDWMTLLAPARSALVLGAATIIGAVTTGIAGRINVYLDSSTMCGRPLGFKAV